MQRYTLKAQVFDLHYKKFQRKGYSKKSLVSSEEKSDFKSGRMQRQIRKRNMQTLEGSQGPANVTKVSKPIPPNLESFLDVKSYIRQPQFAPESFFDLLHLLAHLQDLFVLQLSSADYDLFNRYFFERRNYTMRNSTATYTTLFGTFRLDTSVNTFLSDQCQQIGNKHGLHSHKDFALFFRMSHRLFIDFRTAAFSLINFGPKELRLNPHFSLAFHDSYALAPSSFKQYQCTLRQFSVFLLDGDGPRALEITLDFLNTSEYANNLIANFLLCRAFEPYSLMFTTLRNKMIYLSFFQRHRADNDRFTKCDFWLKFFFNNSLGRLFAHNSTGAPPFSKSQLLQLFDCIKNADINKFPNKRRDLPIFKYAATLALRTIEASDIIWDLTDFDDNFLIQGILGAKNDKIHSKGQFLYFQRSGSPDCPVALINQLWNLRDKNSHFILSDSKGRPHSNKSLNALLKRYLHLFLSKAEAKKFSFYSFRTSYVAIMSTAHEHEPLDTIRKLLRQKVITSTEHYHAKRFSRPPTTKANYIKTIQDQTPSLEILDPSLLGKFFSETNHDDLLKSYHLDHFDLS